MRPRSEMGESEADADASSYAGSAFSDGLHHTASGHYHYFVVSSPPDASDLHIDFEHKKCRISFCLVMQQECKTSISVGCWSRR